jgi:hypothetical protein
MDFEPGDMDGAKTRATAALAAGVTLLIDKGWRDATAVNLVDHLPADERPEIEAASVMHAVAGGYYAGFAKEIAPGAIARDVEAAAMTGRGWVKLVGDWPRPGQGPLPNFSEAELSVAVEVAALGGARVAIHTMAPDVPSMAVRAGVQSIEHGLFLTSDDIRDLGERGGMWVPTVVQMEAIVIQLGSESSGGRLILEGLQNVQALLGEAVEAGVHVLTGTDLAISSAEVAKEAIRLSEMGMSPESVVRAVSVSGFEAVGGSPRFEPGESADVVLFSANPVDDPGVLGHPTTIVRKGSLVS